MLSDDIVIEIFTFSVLELMKVTENTIATSLQCLAFFVAYQELNCFKVQLL